MLQFANRQFRAHFSFIKIELKVVNNRDVFPIRALFIVVTRATSAQI